MIGPVRVAHRYQKRYELRIVATVTQAPPQIDAQWTHPGARGAAGRAGGDRAPLAVGRGILASCDVKPHRVRGWLNRPADPAFHTKAQAVCRLYLGHRRGHGAVQRGREDRHAGPISANAPPARSGPAGSNAGELECVRHGTVSLMAAMNVTTGTIHPKIIQRNDSDTFIEFLTELATTVEPDKKIHLILDNGSSHTSRKTRKWLREHPAVHRDPHPLPRHSG